MSNNKAVIEVFHCGDPKFPYPWNFRVKFKGVTHHFIGIPNMCATRGAAYARAKRRATWMENGTFEKHYKPMLGKESCRLA
jgi:hypothetical protein